MTDRRAASIRRPPPLRPGDRIALVATSWGAVHHLADRSERAVGALRALGYEPVMMPHASGGTDGTRDWVSATAADRLSDVHDAFADPTINGLLSVIGGDHCAQLLEGLDMDVVRANPKVFCGYSDTTCLLHGIHQATGLVTFYGPALVPEFGEPEGPDHEVVAHWQRVIGSSERLGLLPSVAWQSGESRVESDPEGRNMRRRKPEPRVSLRAGEASGPLLAACLPSMMHLAGTPWWPDVRGRILVVECPEEPYDVAWADANMTQLRNMGVFDEVAGLVIGRTDNWSAADVGLLHHVVLEPARGYSFPVLAGVEVSHSAPLLTIPIGVPGTMSGLDLSIDEPAVSAEP